MAREATKRARRPVAHRPAKRDSLRRKTEKARVSSRESQRRKLQNLMHGKLNLPRSLGAKVKFLLSKAENRETFFARVGEIFPHTDPRYALIKKAYDTAEIEFAKIHRESGELYFEHLRAVALILIVYMRVRNADLIAASLLHDIVEDIKGWTVERVDREFNDRVATYVYWLTKPQLGGQCKTKADVDRKYHRQLRDAPREVIMVKMADRLHNLITMWDQEAERMWRKINETKDFLLPLAEMHFILVHEIEEVLRCIEKKLNK